MSVVGIPLLLALFQFTNDHIYDRWDEKLTTKTQLFGGAMILSSYLLLYMFYAGLCVINNTLPTSRLTVSISIFIVPLFIIIFVTLYAQFKQMVQPGLRLGAWLASIGIAFGYISIYVAIADGNFRQRITAYGLMVVFLLSGWVASQPRSQTLIRTLHNRINSRQSDPKSDDNDEPKWWGID